MFSLHFPRLLAYLLAILSACHICHSRAAEPAVSSESGGGMCMPSVTAPPCAQGDAAGVGSNEPSLNMGVGNPVHLATGAKQQTDVDLPASVTHPDLEIVRHYNSLRPGDSPMGTGWRFSYDTRVVVRQGAAQIEQANGARIVFEHAGAASPYGTLTRQEQGWQWVWGNGRTLDFDADGNLVRLRDGEVVTDIVRHQGALAPAIVSVRSGTTQLNFHYRADPGPARIAAIDTPAGRFSYGLENIAAITPATDTSAQDSAAPTPLPSSAVRLTRVTRPDGMQRDYLYEAEYQSGNAQLPTGVVLVQPARPDHAEERLRISAWDYDAQGRAVGVALGERDAKHGYSRIHYLRTASAVRPGRTRVDSPAGQTRFTFALIAGAPRLLTVEGAPCPACAPPGTRASYDEQGRLTSINGTRITRDAGGRMIAVEPADPGWPGLRIRTSASGARRQWRSALTGIESTQNQASSHTAVRQFANGDRTDIVYDDTGRILRVRESRPVQGGSLYTTLHWNGKQLHCVQHSNATEVYRYDEEGRLTERTEFRRVSTLAVNDSGLLCEMYINAAGIWDFTERFVYDTQGRLTTHFLPEGGAIHTTWGNGTQVHAITWEDAEGTQHPVIFRVAGKSGYRYGNGLHLTTSHKGQAQTSLTLSDATSELWRETRRQDARGLVQSETFVLRAQSQANPEASDGLAPQIWSTLEDWRYAYDAQERMIGAQQAGDTPLWFAWNDDGSLAASASAARAEANTPTATEPPAAAPTPRQTQKPVIARDLSGLPTKLDDLIFQYDTNRRLSAVARQGKPLAFYTHNAWGQRIRAEIAAHTIDYLYLGNRRVADAVRTNRVPVITRRYLYAHDVPVGMIIYNQGRGELYAIHADLLGAPRMVTDTHATIRWLANYTPLGEAHQIAGDLQLDLRLPGQWFDAETGFHDNLMRTYLPQWGQYLEPDPLGPVPGSQALGYAAQQPRRFVDPLGLILFAFDGTRNDARTNSNVSRFLQRYNGGLFYYHAGPGNPYELDWDAITAFKAPIILAEQWGNLLAALRKANTSPAMRDAHTGSIPIDLIGFSRGAALARHFGNMILAQTHDGLFSYQDSVLGLVSACVDFRFLGLYDTVAQFGINGSKNSDYDLTVAEPWRWVAHAVALHDYRYTFPLSSTQGSPNTHIIEVPFIGAHSDIGGGNLLDPNDTPRRGDLDKVTLNWLWWQAQAAGVPLKPPTDEQQRVHEAILNNTPNPPTASIGLSIDRYVINAQGISGRLQENFAGLGRTERQAVNPLIHETFEANRQRVYTVDMSGYRAWLKQELGWDAQFKD